MIGSFSWLNCFCSSVVGHLVTMFFLAQTPFGEPTWGPNVDEFRKRFDPDSDFLMSDFL